MTRTSTLPVAIQRTWSATTIARSATTLAACRPAAECSDRATSAGEGRRRRQRDDRAATGLGSRARDELLRVRPHPTVRRHAGRRWHTTRTGPSKRHYPQNEIWLGFRTDARGDATASTRQYWLHKGTSQLILMEPRPTSRPTRLRHGGTRVVTHRASESRRRPRGTGRHEVCDHPDSG